MLRALAISAVAVVTGGSLAGAASPAFQATGRLAGETQISFGCPGPVSESGPTCNPWHPFPHARFSVARRGADGLPVPGTSRLVVSDARAHFALRLATGRYLVTPLPQSNTRGGTRVSARVRAGVTAKILVRFLGFPQMV